VSEKGKQEGKRRTLLIMRVDVDALVAELLVVELDVVLVLTKAVKEVDVLAVVCGPGEVSAWRGE
jgi:hypothetical protein